MKVLRISYLVIFIILSFEETAFFHDGTIRTANDHPDHLNRDIILQGIVFDGVLIVTPSRCEVHPEDILIRFDEACKEKVVTDSVDTLVR